MCRTDRVKNGTEQKGLEINRVMEQMQNTKCKNVIQLQCHSCTGRWKYTNKTRSNALRSIRYLFHGYNGPKCTGLVLKKNQYLISKYLNTICSLNIQTNKCFSQMNLLCLAIYFCLALKDLDTSRIQKKNHVIKVIGDHTKKGCLGLYL